LKTCVREKVEPTIETPSEKFQELDYAEEVYYKTSQWLLWLQQHWGKIASTKPYAAITVNGSSNTHSRKIFKKVMEQGAGRNLDSAFLLLHQQGILPNMKRHGRYIKTIVGPHYFSNWLDNTYKELVNNWPCIGCEQLRQTHARRLYYECAAATNNFKFFAAPMYAIGSKRFTGIGKIDYTYYPKTLSARSMSS